MIQDEQTRAAWERYIAHREIEPGSIRTDIVRSWLRCEQQGVDHRSGGSSVIVNGKELEALLARNAALIDAARPFMRSLYELMENSGFAVILVDRDGFVVEVIGDAVVLESHRGIQYVNGVKWTEDLVGTTAISLVLLGSGPIQVAGYEHYCQKHQDWACSAAPLTDSAGDLLGVLSVTGRKEQVHCHTLGMVVSAAAAINNYLAVQKAQKELEQTASIHSTIVNKVSDGLLMIDAKGIVTFVNPTGAKILNINPAEALGKHISTLVDFRPVVLRVLETGQGYTDKEFVIETKRGILHFIKTAIPLKNSKGELEGVIDIFREIKRIRQLVTKMVGATAQFSFEDIVGNSQAMKECVRLAKIAANSAATVLIQGESGTGKELIAQAIHNASLRSEGPFIAINCGAIPRNLVESELFGYEDGAFTGAKQGGRPGKFELAHGGTIFLDEIGEMPLDIQVKLLRVLQEKRITRVGGQRYLDIDVRVIAATNRDVAVEVREGNFRHDLYYRLNVLPIYVPPLRERLEDIPPLLDYLLKKMCRQLDVDDKCFSNDALARIMTYEWPGNVRELENVVERAVNICEYDEIGAEYLPRTMGEKTEVAAWSQLSLRDAEKKIIKETLHNTRGNISHAAKLLGIGRNTLYSKLRDYAITVPKENEMFTN
ncbi:MAG: sigma 54-interacting transcriptional regulator [Sporomusaceae bacterium]|nr:sigma 54-interacting transcriptional regulator [Sporomusaceae bacterium]